MSLAYAHTTVLKPIDLQDRAWLEATLRRAALPHCEYCFATLWTWRRCHDPRWAVLDDGWVVLRVRGLDGRDRYLSPVGNGDPGPAADWCLADLAATGGTPELCLVPERICAALAGRYSVAEDRDNADYVYRREDLADLPGRHYAAKRNHIHRFERAHPGWTFTPLGPADLPTCRELAAVWEVGSPEHEQVGWEREALMTCLSDWPALGLVGGVLRAGGRVVGFCLGEPLTDDTFVIHYERADRLVEGAHQALCQAFARSLSPRFRWIDRESDLGVPGLRQAKTSYRPARLEGVGTVR